MLNVGEGLMSSLTIAGRSISYKKAIWQYLSRDLQVLIPFSSVDLFLAIYPKENFKCGQGFGYKDVHYILLFFKGKIVNGVNIENVATVNNIWTAEREGRKCLKFT